MVVNEGEGHQAQYHQQEAHEDQRYSIDLCGSRADLRRARVKLFVHEVWFLSILTCGEVVGVAA